MELSSNAQEVAQSRYFWSTESTWEQLAERVSEEASKIERDSVTYKGEFYNSLVDLDFIPGGRILRNLGKLKPSTSNCNFLPIDDNIESIAETLKNYLIISSYGGGTGINFSSLRPKDTPLNTKGGVSSGLVSFIEMFNDAGMRLETGGQRRAAGIGLCSVSHPEIEEFIAAKVEHNRLNQFNISVVIDDRFLQAVENNEDWNLKFAGKIYRTVKARQLWNKILKNMLEHSEPGIINWSKLIKNNSYYFSPIRGCNPCGEIPLGDYEVCNLASLNLPNFIVGKRTNWQKLEKTIHLAVRFLDNIIDISFYPIPQQENVVKNARRLGLGTMGLGDYLYKKEIRYGSDKSLLEIERLYKFIRDTAYLASMELAKEKGAFPKYDRSQYCSSYFVKKLPAKIRLQIKEHGIRNCTIITCPPTGSTSLLPETSSGIEPIISKAYLRQDGVGKRIYIHPIYRAVIEEGGKKPDWLVDSFDLKPEDHLEVQTIINKYVDNAVSKTINLPKKTTVKDLSKLLLESAYDLKGVTIYRDGTRDCQPITPLSYDEILKYIKDDNGSPIEVVCRGGACEV
jgi:ribonucleoside-diphosphate reductase alpha chain